MKSRKPVGQRRVDLAQAVEVALERLAGVDLPREVAAVADPHRVRAGPQLHAQLEALEVVLDGLAAHRGVGVAQAAELVGERLVRPGPGRCWSSSSRCRARAPARTTAARPALSGLSQGMCSEMPGVERVSLKTTSQSSTFSKTLRGSPGPAKRAKRVPPVPTPHDGTETRKAMARSVSVSMSTPRRASWRPRCS